MRMMSIPHIDSCEGNKGDAPFPWGTCILVGRRGEIDALIYKDYPGLKFSYPQNQCRDISIQLGYLERVSESIVGIRR